jgi:integrase
VAAGKAPKHRPAPSTEDGRRARLATANRIYNVLRAILNYAFAHGLVSNDTEWRRVKAFPRADEPVTRFLTDAEAQRLIHACRKDLRALVTAALFTGARISELANARVADFNPDTALLYIRPGKSGKGRHVPLNEQGQAFFDEIIASRPGDAPLLTRADGAPWGKNHHVRALTDACTTAMITPAITFHDLRHSYASLLAQSGADLLTISRLLGHADTRITSRHYAHLTDESLSAAVCAHLPGFGHVGGKVSPLSLRRRQDRKRTQ